MACETKSACKQETIKEEISAPISFVCKKSIIWIVLLLIIVGFLCIKLDDSCEMNFFEYNLFGNYPFLLFLNVCLLLPLIACNLFSKKSKFFILFIPCVAYGLCSYIAWCICHVLVGVFFTSLLLYLYYFYKKISRKTFENLIKLIVIALILISGLIVYMDIFYVPEDPVVMVKKPIIYLYPEKGQEVLVKVEHPERFTHTYPHYKDGWHVMAEPDGQLKDLNTGRSLYALYWEGEDTSSYEITQGFVVKGSDSVSFLEDKLAMLGLNQREANEFIIYWLPKLESNPYNLISFQSVAQQDENMPLLITPKPQSVIRVRMVFKSLKTPIKIKPQELPVPLIRKGFTVVEWGGIQL